MPLCVSSVSGRQEETGFRRGTEEGLLDKDEVNGHIRYFSYDKSKLHLRKDSTLQKGSCGPPDGKEELMSMSRTGTQSIKDIDS